MWYFILFYCSYSLWIIDISQGEESGKLYKTFKHIIIIPFGVLAFGLYVLFHMDCRERF